MLFSQKVCSSLGGAKRWNKLLLGVFLVGHALVVWINRLFLKLHYTNTGDPTVLLHSTT